MLLPITCGWVVTIISSSSRSSRRSYGRVGQPPTDFRMPKKLPRSNSDTSRGVVDDPRFSSMHSAPTFKKTQKDSNKIIVDERFQTVLTDDRFRAVPGSIDIYGRKTKRGSKSAAEKELHSFYQIDDAAVPEVEVTLKCTNSTKTAKYSSGGKKKGSDEIQKAEDPESRLDYLNRLARGDVSESSSDDSDEGEARSDADSDADEENGANLDDESDRNTKGPLDILSDEEGEGEEAHATCRLALINCDWENLKASDFMSALQSFCPTGETVDRVTVYPSDFGKERMASEAVHGPPKIWMGGNDDSNFEDYSDASDVENDDDDDGYGGIEAIELEEVVTPVKNVKIGDKWKRNGSQAATTSTTATESSTGKEKLSKADRKGDFKRLPGSVGIVLQNDLVVRGKSRADDAGNEEEDSSEEQETDKLFDTDISRGSLAKDSREKGSKLSLKGKDKRNTLERERFTGAGKGDEDGEGGFDEVALRAYELSKLKYFFAVAEISSVEASEALMAQLDGVELGHSSMVFDLRFIPEDTSFEDREIRDQCSEVGLDYQPPDFVVNALQHTTVQCSWDEGEKDRERKLTNISQWRQLQESELLQYVASSDSDDEEEEGEGDEDSEEDSDDDSDTAGVVSRSATTKKALASSQRKQSAANLRRLLLGAGSDDGFSEDSDDGETSKAAAKRKSAKNRPSSDDEDGVEDIGFDDDFFTDDVEKNNTALPDVPLKSKKGKSRAEESNKTFSYVPDAKNHQLATQVDDRDRDETPFEAMQRKLAEKRKARKAAKKLVKSGVNADAADAIDVPLIKKGKSKGGKEEEGRAEATRAELELLLSDDDEDYDMRALHKQEKEVLKGPKSKRKSRSKKPKEPEEEAIARDSTSASGGDFQLDLQDSRFARLLGGDSSFGIDRTSSEFKETKAMKQIFSEQRSRREREEASASRGENSSSKEKNEDAKDVQAADGVDNLVSKLKRRYAEQSSNKPKQARL